MMKKIQLVFLCCLLLMMKHVLMAQPEKDFLNEFNGFVQQSEQQFTSFNDSINRQFAENLKKQWESFSVFAGIPPPLKPKPVVPRKATLESSPVNNAVIAVKEVIPQEKLLPIFEPSIPSFDTLPDTQAMNRSKNLEFTFYGTLVDFTVPMEACRHRLSEISNAAIADFWMKLNEDKLQSLVSQSLLLKDKLRLNDWGVYQLTKSVAQSLFAEAQYNEQTVLVIFLLNAMGYDAKMALDDHSTYCLLHTQQQLYSVPFVRLFDKTYFVFHLKDTFHPNKNNLYTYSFDYPNSIRAVDMNIGETPHFEKAMQAKLLESEVFHQSVKVYYNTNLIDFYHDYPQMEVNVYAEAKVSPEFYSSVRDALQPILQDKSNVEAVTALLHLMHYSFDYAVDEVQFGFEKPLFCEENFYYPYNDCEDRAVLFAFLVRELLGLKTVLVEYSDHVATAVSFGDTELSGDFLVLEHEKYVICDPTYIGASIGMSMSEYKNQPVKVMMLETK